MIAYFDNSATTKPCPEAVEACQQMLTTCWGNPSSVHRMGIQAREQLSLARRRVAQAMGAEEDRVFFTAGGTEADNWAIFSAMELALEGLYAHTTPDAVLLDVEAAMQAMGELTGKTIREDITQRIFERFCVGK